MLGHTPLRSKLTAFDDERYAEVALLPRFVKSSMRRDEADERRIHRSNNNVTRYTGDRILERARAMCLDPLWISLVRDPDSDSSSELRAVLADHYDFFEFELLQYAREARIVRVPRGREFRIVVRSLETVVGAREGGRWDVGHEQFVHYRDAPTDMYGRALNAARRRAEAKAASAFEWTVL